MLSRVLIRQTILFLIACLALYSQTVPPRRLTPSTAALGALPPSRRFSLGAAPRADLGPIEESIRSAPSPRRGAARIAVHRSVAPASMTQGAWQNLADGSSVWRLSIHSQNALGIRLHFTGFSAGAGQVWVHDTATPALQILGPFTGTGRSANGDFWTEAIFSETVEVEYKPETGAAASGLPPFSIAELTHLWRIGPFAAPSSPTASAALAEQTDAFRITAGVRAEAANYSCFLDATCYQDNRVVFDGSHATTMILFGDYQCSATMLNAPNQEPLILTAGHCVNTQTDAAGTEVLFDFRTNQCGQDANLIVSQQYLASLPYALGANLLAFANQPFLDGTSSTEVHNDIDYSLIQLENFPLASDVVLSGYTTSNLAVGDTATGLSHPRTEFMKVSFGRRAQDSVSDGTSFVNAYAVNESNGRGDEGSSGSGLFDQNSLLTGLLSTAESCLKPLPDGSCPATSTSCDVPGPFFAWYTRFSSIYPFIEPYLNLPLSASSSNPAVFRANPNPIYITDGSGLGQTTLYVNYPAASGVQIHLNTIDGPLLSTTSGVAVVPTGKWVTEGLIFYLQDISDGKLLTSDNTIATITMHLGTVTLTASPSSLPYGTYGATTVTWAAANVPSGVDIYVGDTSGPAVLFASAGSSGSATTGKWAKPGTTFYLEDASTHSVLAARTIQGSSPMQAQFTASPNPIVISPGGPQVGQTTVAWNVPPPGADIEIHLGSPAGPLFAASGSSGTATTGLWPGMDGLTFYLQNVTNGLPLTAANTLATTTVFVVPE